MYIPPFQPVRVTLPPFLRTRSACPKSISFVIVLSSLTSRRTAAPHRSLVEVAHVVAVAALHTAREVLAAVALPRAHCSDALIDHAARRLVRHDRQDEHGHLGEQDGG